MLLAIDGVNEEELDSVLRIELQARTERGRQSASVLRRAADCAPAMGLIGTLIGLVQMLGQLDDPSAIGPSMAIALLTTFYGAVLANIVLTPLAVRSSSGELADEATVRADLSGSARCRSRGRRTRAGLRPLLNSVLPPDQRDRLLRSPSRLWERRAMRLLIIGRLEGQIGAASRIAIARGAKVTHADDIDTALACLRSGQGADLVLADVQLDIALLIQPARAPNGSPCRSSPAASAPTAVPPLPRSGRAPRNTCRCRPIPS